MNSVYHPIRTGVNGVAAVKRYYEDRGYEVSHVTRGADLRVRGRNGHTKLVEVKASTTDITLAQLAGSVSKRQRRVADEVCHANFGNGILTVCKPTVNKRGNYGLRVSTSALMG